MRIRVPGVLVHHIAYGLTSTWPIVRLHEDRAEAAQRIAPGGAVVGIFWHQSLLIAAACHHHRHVAALTSRSADGGIMAAHLQRIGIRTVRGSSRRGGVEAAKELMRAIADGWMIATACDGPTGPAFISKAGPLEIARRHQVPLVPMGFGARRYLDVTQAWDRFRLPCPGSRVVCAYGEAIMYPPHEPGTAELHDRIAAVGDRIRALEAEAMCAAGRGA